MARYANLRRRALLLSFGLLNFSVAVGAQGEYDQRLQRAKEESRLGNFPAAIIDLEAALLLEAANPEGWYQLGLLRGEMGDFPAAEAAFRHAIQLKPDLPKAHYSLGLTLVANSRNKLDWPSAIAELREALKYQPDYPEALNLLGAGLTSMGDPEAAIPELQYALHIKPGLPEAHLNFAIALERTNRLDEAVTEYRTAGELRGNHPEAFTALGKLMLRMGKLAEAEQALSMALCLNPDLGDAHYVLGRVLLALGKSKQASIEIDTAKELSQREQDAFQSAQLSNQGLELASKGDLPAATEITRNAIALKPDYGVPHFNLGLFLADRGDLLGASHELAKAISLMPGQVKPWYSLGRVYRRQGNLSGALTLVSWAARMAPSDQTIRAELVSLQQETQLQAIIQNDVGPPVKPKVGSLAETGESHLAFGLYLFRQKDFQGALGEFLRSLALTPSGVAARRSLASAYEESGQPVRASLELYKLVRITPDDPEAHLALGRVLLRLDNVETATQEFRTVLRLRPGSKEAKTALEGALRRSSPRSP